MTAEHWQIAINVTAILFSVAGLSGAIWFGQQTKRLSNQKKAQLVFHKKTGRMYRILYQARMKHPSSRDWVDCLIYEAVDGEGGWFVRRQTEFAERFARPEEM